MGEHNPDVAMLIEAELGTSDGRSPNRSSSFSPSLSSAFSSNAWRTLMTSSGLMGMYGVVGVGIYGVEDEGVVVFESKSTGKVGLSACLSWKMLSNGESGMPLLLALFCTDIRHSSPSTSSAKCTRPSLRPIPILVPLLSKMPPETPSALLLPPLLLVSVKFPFPSMLLASGLPQLLAAPLVAPAAKSPVPGPSLAPLSEFTRYK